MVLLSPCLWARAAAFCQRLSGSRARLLCCRLRQRSNWRRATDRAVGMFAGSLVLISRSPKSGFAGPPGDPFREPPIKRKLPATTDHTSQNESFHAPLPKGHGSYVWRRIHTIGHDIGRIVISTMLTSSCDFLAIEVLVRRKPIGFHEIRL